MICPNVYREQIRKHDFLSSFHFLFCYKFFNFYAEHIHTRGKSLLELWVVTFLPN